MSGDRIKETSRACTCSRCFQKCRSGLTPVERSVGAFDTSLDGLQSNEHNPSVFNHLLPPQLVASFGRRRAFLVGAKETRRSSLSSRGFLVPFSRSSPGSSSWNERKRSLKEYKVQSATRLQRCEKGSKGELKRTESIGLTVRILSKKPILLSAYVRD